MDVMRWFKRKPRPVRNTRSSLGTIKSIEGHRTSSTNVPRKELENKYLLKKDKALGSQCEVRRDGICIKVQSDAVTILDFWYLLGNNDPTGDEIMNFLIQGAEAGTLTYTITKE